VKAPPRRQMKISVQCFMCIRHACSLSSKLLLKSNCNSCSYCSDLNLLCYLPFLLTLAVRVIAYENIFWPCAVLKKTHKANEFGELASFELVFPLASLTLVPVFN
jgi:hypothetical protein